MPKIQTDGLETYYEVRGRGPPLVLVHAATLDQGAWAAQVEGLAGSFRVVTYDLRGHGRDADGDPGGYTVATLAEDLHALVVSLGLERPVVCGHSLGGMVAMTYASRYPDELGGLVLAGAPTPPRLSFTERFQRTVFPRFVANLARLVGYNRLRGWLVWVHKRLYGEGAGGSFSASDLPPMSTPAFVSSVRCFSSFHEVPVDLAAIRDPTLVVNGADEPPFLLRHAEYLETRVRDARSARIPNAGHAMNLDQPERFNEVVRAFAAGSIDPGQD